jgi:hypothetical protein
MTTVLTETGPWGSEAGVSDHVFVQRLRQLLRDNPVPANEQANGNGTSTFFQMQKVPIHDDKYVVVAVSGVSVPLTNSRGGITTSNCYIDYDSGMLIFGTPPAAGAGNITIQKQRVRWSESVLLQSLQGGVRQLFPQLYKRAMDLSITMQVNQWVYELPQDFWDPRVQILAGYLQEVPSSVNRPVPISGIYRLGLRQLQVPTSQWFTPGATLWLEYKAPYRSLSELEPQAYDLPLWYAAAQLLGFDEARRTRMDTITPTAESSANPPQYLQNAGSWYMTQFKALLAQLTAPPARMPRPVSTYSF